jgi:hypothetical protein
MQGEIDSMNVSVAAAILILKPKDNEVLNYIFDSRIKKTNKIMKTNYSLYNINHNTFFRTNNRPQVDALVNKTLTAFNVPGIAVAIIKDGK